MKSPIVSRKRLDSQRSYFEAKIRCYEDEACDREREISDLKHDLVLAEQGIKKVLPRLVRVNKPVPAEFNTYRLCIDIHRDAAERAFIHGSDDNMIKYFARLLAHEVERKMIRLNFARCDQQTTPVPDNPDRTERKGERRKS